MLTYYGAKIMAVITKSQKPETPLYRQLVAALVEELQRNQPTGPATAPQIIEEEQRGGFFHISVIWDAWQDVDRAERGKIIMDAYEKQQRVNVAKITVALGLTHAEAERLSVRV